MRLHAATFFAILGLSACASVPKGDGQKDAVLKNFMPQPGVSGIYVFRNEGVAATSMDVEIDGQNVGRIVNRTYLYVEVAPGRHVVVGKAGNTTIPGVEFTTVLRKLYYVRQEPKSGWTSFGSRLTQVDDIEAQREIKRSSLAAGNPNAAP